MCIPVEKTSTKHGSLAIRVEGYNYRREREYAHYTTWRCTRKTCKARCKTSNESNERQMKLIGRSITEHNHETDEKANMRSDIRQTIKRDAEERLNDRTAKLICTGVAGKEQRLTTRDVHNLRACLYKHRVSTRPPLPRSLEGTLDILQEVVSSNAHFGMLNNGRRMVRRIDRTKRVAMLCSEENLRLLCENGVEVFADGTFTFCPTFFYQLFTLHVYKNGFYIPAAFFLLPDKKTRTYASTFPLLKTEAASLGLTLNFAKLLLDFEPEIHKAANQIFPQATIRGCHFRLAQNWWKKIQNLGLAPLYSNDCEAGQWLRLCFGLPALDPDLIEDCFAFELMPAAPPQVMPFADFLLSTYIDPSAAFPPSTWAGLATCGLKTTNSGCEGFHRHFGDLGDLYSLPTPNIFEFLENLKELHVSTALQLRSPDSRTRRNQGLNHAQLHMHLRANELTFHQFLSIVSKDMLPDNIY